MAVLAQLTGASVRYGDGTVVFEEVSFEVYAGELVALVGPQGAGKTSLLHALAGLVPLTAGTVVRFAPVAGFVSTVPVSDPSIAVGADLEDRRHLIVADDPTPFMAVESAAAARVALRDLAAAGHGVVVATLDPALVALADRTVEVGL